MNQPLYSIRMRAARADHHLSGAERLVGPEELDRLAAELVQRALHHGRGRAETIHISIEEVPAAGVMRRSLPALRTCPVDDYRQGRQTAAELLCRLGVSPVAIQAAMTAMAEGPAPGGRAMRGAMLIDASSGARLEADRARGVRVSRMDLTAQARGELTQGLERLQLDNLHVREALVLAGKVLCAPGILAELCWSDDPDYTAGYVASTQFGYVRFPHLKALGDEGGGRAFFLAGGDCDLHAVVDFLQNRPLLFDRIGPLHRPLPWAEQPWMTGKDG